MDLMHLNTACQADRLGGTRGGKEKDALTADLMQTIAARFTGRRRSKNLGRDTE
jgi:hypothetical protein